MKTLLFLFFTLTVNSLFAQTFTVVADSLRIPAGIEVDALGRIWVTEVGYGFNDGAVSVVEPDGDVLPVIVGLPSLFDTSTQESVGPWHSLDLAGDKIAVAIGTIGEVRTFDLNGFTPGVSPPMTAASSTSAVNVAAYVLGQGFAESNPYSLAYDAAGNLYVADAAANAVIKATEAGQLSVFATFPGFPNPLPFGPPVVDAVPTRILAKPGGGFYVSQLTGFPFLDSAATVFSLDPNGVVSPYASGLTLLTDLAPDANTGDLYALQFGRFDLSIFNYLPNSAKIIRLKSDGTRETVAEDFGPSAGLALDGQGSLYVTEIFSGRLLKMEGVATGTAETGSDLAGFALSPNPATDLVRIDFSLKNSGAVQIRILDAEGRTVFSQNLGVLEAGSHQTTWQAFNRPAGLYWVDIQTKAGTKTQQLVLSH